MPAVDIEMARQPAGEFNFTHTDILGVDVWNHEQPRRLLRWHVKPVRRDSFFHQIGADHNASIPN